MRTEKVCGSLWEPPSASLEQRFDTGQVMSTPDQLLESALHTEAKRLTLEGGRIDEAVEVLRDMAGGREDLVAGAAGILGGAWTVRSGRPCGCHSGETSGPRQDSLAIR
jgi:hypothetical protein